MCKSRGALTKTSCFLDSDTLITNEPVTWSFLASSRRGPCQSVNRRLASPAGRPNEQFCWTSRRSATSRTDAGDRRHRWSTNTALLQFRLIAVGVGVVSSCWRAELRSPAVRRSHPLSTGIDGMDDFLAGGPRSAARSTACGLDLRLQYRLSGHERRAIPSPWRERRSGLIHVNTGSTWDSADYLRLVGSAAVSAG